MYKDSYNEIFQNKQRILVVFSHPDDAEIYAGATLSRLITSGKEVCIVKMSLGNKGSRQENISEHELASLRLEEDRTAMKSLGIKDENNIYLDFSDGSIDNSLKTIEAIAKVIRKFKPDIILTHNPEHMIIRWAEGTNWINHRDHRNTGMSVLDAAYPYSRDTLFFPEQLNNEGLTPHIVSEFLFVDYYDHPDTVAIDVTQNVDERTKAIACHSSQYSMEHAKESTDFFTKIDDSGKRYERFRYVVAD